MENFFSKDLLIHFNTQARDYIHVCTCICDIRAVVILHGRKRNCETLCTSLLFSINNNFPVDNKHHI